MSSRGRWMGKVKSDSVPTRFVLLDTERTLNPVECSHSSYSVGLISGLAVACNWKGGKLVPGIRRPFAEAEHFWEWMLPLLNRGESVWVIGWDMYEQAAALGMFRKIRDKEVLIHIDSGETLDGIEYKNGWQGACITSDPPTIIVCRHKGRRGTMRFLDIRNYGVRESDLTLCQQERLEQLKSWLSAYISCITRHGLGSMQSTAASQSVIGWRRTYQTQDIHLHDYEKAMALEREAIVGGRCECRVIGTVRQRNELFGDTGPQVVANGLVEIDGPVYQVDINSAYPFAASTLHIPYCLATYVENPAPDWIAGVISGNACIADVVVSTTAPMLPMRLKDRKIVVYPTGTFRTVLATPELEYAIEAGLVSKVIRLAAYKCSGVFDDYIRRLYELRTQYKAQGMPMMADCLKSIMVGLHGKLSQRDKKWVRVGEYKSPYAFAAWFGTHPVTGELTKWRCIGWAVEYLDDIGEGNNTFPAITAVIQSTVRVLLANAMSIVGFNRIWYYDTDSIWTDAIGYNTLSDAGVIDNDKLGHFKLAGVYRQVEFKGIKHYIADDKIVHAGKPKEKSRVGCNKSAILQQHSVDTYCWSNLEPQPIVTDLTRKYNEPYRHGKVLPSGLVVPLHMKGGVDDGIEYS